MLSRDTYGGVNAQDRFFKDPLLACSFDAHQIGREISVTRVVQTLSASDTLLNLSRETYGGVKAPHRVLKDLL